MTPRGSVSIIMDEGAKSDDIDTHTRTATIKVHRADLAADGSFAGADEVHSMHDEPGHQDLCEREQAFVLNAIRDDVDLGRHMRDAVRSLAVVLAADESVRSGKPVRLDNDRQNNGPGD
jgi:hypothetical protein